MNLKNSKLLRSPCSHILLITDTTCVMLTKHYFMSDLQIRTKPRTVSQKHGPSFQGVPHPVRYLP